MSMISFSFLFFELFFSSIIIIYNILFTIGWVGVFILILLTLNLTHIFSKKIYGDKLINYPVFDNFFFFYLKISLFLY